MKIEQFQKRRTDIISKMLDNPDEHGIYPTGQCYAELDELFEKLRRQSERLDELDEKIGKFYEDENAEGQLCEIGETAAAFFGYLGY